MSLRDEIQDRLAEGIRLNPNQILEVSVRLGKTRVALKTIEEGDTTLVVYPIKNIKQSWEDELKIFTPKSTNITFVTKNSVHKYVGQTFDNLFIDEPQLCASPKQLTSLKGIRFRKKRIALTGAISSKTKRKYYNALGMKVGLTYTMEDAIKDGLVKDYEVFIHLKSLDDDVKMPYEKFGNTFYKTERMIYQEHSDNIRSQEEKIAKLRLEPASITMQETIDKAIGLKEVFERRRMNFIYESPTLLTETGRLLTPLEKEKVLIYTLRTDIADMLSYASYHSKNKEEDRLQDFLTSTDGHLAVVNCTQAGVTIRNLNRVVFHSYESNSETLLQKLARSLLYEYEGEKSRIDILCLLETQMVEWISQACRELDQEKIYYVFPDGTTVKKLDYIRQRNPDKELYLFRGAVVYYTYDQQDGNWMNRYYKYLGGGDKAYPLPYKQLKKL